MDTVVVDQSDVMAMLDTPVTVEVDETVRPYDLDEAVTVDFTGVTLDEVWVPGKYPCRCTKLSKKTSKKGIPYWALEWMVLAGPNKTKFINDMCMMSGGGLKKTLCLYAALGLTIGNEVVTVTGRDLFEKDVWLTIVNKPDQQNQEKLRSQVDFEGYEPIEKYPLPADNDPFANPGEVGNGNPFEG